MAENQNDSGTGTTVPPKAPRRRPPPAKRSTAAALKDEDKKAAPPPSTAAGKANSPIQPWMGNEVNPGDGTTVSPDPAVAAEGEAAKASTGPEKYLEYGPKDIEAVHVRIRKTQAKLNDLDAKSAAINAERRALYEGLEAIGLNRDGVRAGIAHGRMNEKRREGYDESYGITRKVTNLPIQTDLMDSAPAALEGSAKH